LLESLFLKIFSKIAIQVNTKNQKNTSTKNKKLLKQDFKNKNKKEW